MVQFQADLEGSQVNVIQDDFFSHHRQVALLQIEFYLAELLLEGQDLAVEFGLAGDGLQVGLLEERIDDAVGLTAQAIQVKHEIVSQAGRCPQPAEAAGPVPLPQPGFDSRPGFAWANTHRRTGRAAKEAAGVLGPRRVRRSVA